MRCFLALECAEYIRFLMLEFQEQQLYMFYQIFLL